MQRANTGIAELPPERTVHIRKHFPKPFSDVLQGVDLPYGLLRGEGLERLCALVLVADGQTPRYFGDSGTSDYGVDIVVSNGATCTVYQCKNRATYKRGDLRDWLNKFARDWLRERPYLPKPEKYVAVCPLDVREKDDVETTKTLFHDQYGVCVELWHKTFLDTRLKHLPDVVADLFSSTVADFFCSLDHRWDDGFTAPLAPAGRGARAVDRFLLLQEEGRFAHAAEDLQDRIDLLYDDGLVGFVGVSGSGKTMAALELVSSIAEAGWRPWYVDMRNADVARLYESIERRTLRPSIFVLDDCHLALGVTLSILTRFRTAGLGRRARLVLTVTTGTTDDDMALDQGEISQFVRETIDLHQQIVMRPKGSVYSRIIATARPDLGKTPIKTVEHLLAVTAGDLFLLDEVLRVTEGSESDRSRWLDTITVETFQQKVMERYFGERYPYAPTIRRIAAVAQFDLPVPKKAIEVPSDKLNDRMLVSIGPPPAWLFTHAALAELIYCALSIAEADKDPNQFAVDAIVTQGLGDMRSDHWAEKLTRVLGARLKLTDDRSLKRRLLNDDRVCNALREAAQNLSLQTLSLASFLSTDTDVPSPYLDLLFNRIMETLSGAKEFPAQDVPLYGMALRTLSLADVDRFKAILETARHEPLVQAIAASADLPAAMRILQNVTPGFADKLIKGLNAATLDALVQRTIDGTRPIGTINLALRELGERDKERRQLAAFEARLGTKRMTRLIRERADLPAAMRILQYVTPGFADKLIKALDAATLDTLVDNTITSEDSPIRHLPLNKRFFAHLEIQLASDAWWRLVSGCGDLGGLSSILVALGSAARAALLAKASVGMLADWTAMLARTNAFGFGAFLLDAEALLSNAARATFEQAAALGIDGIITRSTWSELARSLSNVSDLPDSRGKALFLERLRAQVGTVDLASPSAIDDFVSAASLVRLLWQERAQERQTLANAIFDILPPHERWPLDHRRLIGSRLVLELAQSHDMPYAMAEHLLDACAHLSDDVNVSACDARTLFLYLFSIWAVLVARAPSEGRKTLIMSQDQKFWVRLLDHLDKLARERTNKKKLGILALVGLLEFTSVFPMNELERHIRGVVYGFRFLLDAAEEDKAVTRFFAFRGLAIIGPPRLANDRERIQKLLDDLSKYPDQTPVLRLIRDDLSLSR